MNRLRLLAAFMVAPAVPALVFALPGVVAGASGVLSMFMLACVVTYSHAVVLGAPLAWLLARTKMLALWHVIGAAFLIGALPFGGFTLYQELTVPAGAGYTSNGVVIREDGRLTSAGLKSTVLGVFQCGLLGATAGLVWWLVARPRAGAFAR